MLTALLFSTLLVTPHSSVQEQEEWEQIRSIAEAQHEIIMLHIRNGQFDKVPAAFQKIFSLNFPKEREHLLVEEAKIVSDALVQANQHLLAHQILDEALKVVRSKQSRAALYKEKGYLCVKEGKDDLAMELFEKAVEIESSQP